jgi:hypothetical protein
MKKIIILTILLAALTATFIVVSIRGSETSPIPTPAPTPTVTDNSNNYVPNSVLAPTPVPTPNPTPTPVGEIIIKHSYTATTVINEYTKAHEGMTFLVIHLDITNNDPYSKYSFNTNPARWQVTLNNIMYSYSFSTYQLKDSLNGVNILPNGNLKGSLAFEVPMENNYDYTINYYTLQNDPPDYKVPNIKYISNN